MNAVLKELLLQAVTTGSLGLTFIQGATDVAVYSRGVVKHTELSRLSLTDFGEIVLYLGSILKADLADLREPLKRKIKLKVGDDAHLFEFLFTPTRPLNMNINLVDEDLARFSLETMGFEKPILQSIRDALLHETGLLVLSAPDLADLDELYLACLAFLAESHRKTVSFEPDTRFAIPGVSRYVAGPGGADPAVVLAPASLRVLLDAGTTNLACRIPTDGETGRTLVNVALSEMAVIVCVEAKDCLTSFMAVKKAGIATSSLLEACRFLVNVRKVHKVCPFCKETVIITPEMLPPSLQGARQLVDVKAYRGTGCKECRTTGVSGTTLLFETMEVDSERINIDELTRTKKPLKNHLLETGLLKPMVKRAHSALLSGRITLDEFIDIVGKL